MSHLRSISKLKKEAGRRRGCLIGGGGTLSDVSLQGGCLIDRGRRKRPGEGGASSPMEQEREARIGSKRYSGGHTSLSSSSSQFTSERVNPPSSSFREDNLANIFDIIGYLSKPDPNVDLPKTSIFCKPSIQAIEHALRIANIDPQRTVVDLLVPYQKGGKIGLFDGAGVGKTGFIMKLMVNNIGKGWYKRISK
ncbi:hypothetical protein ZIOFF_018206 [Zingiber officinale]|uniref:Uncharacterized protein n=1 Tax=Zingiber officinale TaxID=94328 RepID=A0A8J5HCN9_ZINOF|nr:hypothetical protein ZIOFF_018206 [Zingiber officinale]